MSIAYVKNPVKLERIDVVDGRDRFLWPFGVKGLSKARERDVLRLYRTGPRTWSWDRDKVADSAGPAMKAAYPLFRPNDAVTDDRQFRDIPDRAIQEEAITRVLHLLAKPELQAGLGYME